MQLILPPKLELCRQILWQGSPTPVQTLVFAFLDNQKKFVILLLDFFIHALAESGLVSFPVIDKGTPMFSNQVRAQV